MPTSRIADPADPARVFSWLLDFSFDDRGNAISYVYKAEDDAGAAGVASEANRMVAANRYLKQILYGNDTPYLPGEGTPSCRRCRPTGASSSCSTTASTT